MSTPTNHGSTLTTLSDNRLIGSSIQNGVGSNTDAVFIESLVKTVHHKM